MSEAFGSDYLTIEDEDGNEFELEVLDEFELDGQSYLAALPADMDEDDPDFGIVLLKIIEENGEELFGSIDDDDELDKVYDYYMQEVFADDDRPACALSDGGQSLTCRQFQELTKAVAAILPHAWRPEDL